MGDRPILFSAPMVRALLDGRKTQTRRIVKPRPVSAGYPPLISFNHGVAEFSFGPDDRKADGLRWWRCPYGQFRDVLWVKETYRVHESYDGLKPTLVGAAMGGDYAHCVDYVATPRPDAFWGKTRPAIHMPRWASRLTLRVTDVRVERVQDISEADAIAEGLYRSTPDDEDRDWFKSRREDEGRPPTPEEWAEFEEGVWMVPGVPQRWGMTPAERRRDQWAPDPQFAYRLIWEHIHGPGSWDANPWVWAVTFERVPA